MSVTLKQFIRSLCDSGLMTAGEVRAFFDALSPEHKPADARDLAEELVSRNQLSQKPFRTLWQT